MEKPGSQQGHRDACDACHARKVRCLAAKGACPNCVSSGTICVYSPKIPAGRPRKTKRTATSKSSDIITKAALGKGQHGGSSAASESASPRPHASRTQSYDSRVMPQSSASMSNFQLSLRDSNVPTSQQLGESHAPGPPPSVQPPSGQFEDSMYDFEMADGPMDFTLQDDLFSWSSGVNADDTRPADDSFFHGLATYTQPAPSGSHILSPGSIKNQSTSDSLPITVSGAECVSLPQASQPSSSALVDFVMELPTLMARRNSATSMEENWLRDDDPIFISSTSLCNIMEQMVLDLHKRHVKVSQSEMGLYLVHKACNTIIETLQATLMSIKMTHFHDSAQWSGERPAYSRSTSTESTMSSLSLTSASTRSDDSLGDMSAVLAGRLRNTVHLTSSGYQMARLGELLGHVVDVVGRSGENMPVSVPLKEMQHNCVRIDSVVSEMQQMADALKAPVH